MAAPTWLMRGASPVKCISPVLIEPPHDPEYWEHLYRLAKRMKKCGWTGRPLLLVRAKKSSEGRFAYGLHEDWNGIRARIPPRLRPPRALFARAAERDARYQSLTGSHRIAAALWAKLKCVPAVVLDSKGTAALERARLWRRRRNKEGWGLAVYPPFLSRAFRKAGLYKLASVAAMGAVDGEETR